MPRKPNPEPRLRKSIDLPISLWDDLAHWRVQERVASDTEAIRRLLIEALRLQEKKAKP